MNDIPESEELPVGPGQVLTDARLKLGLAPENAAEMLHLSVHQVQALEANDYSRLPEPTYVKGYLRAYCQLLSLDPEPVIAAYSAATRPVSQNEAFEGIAPKKQAMSNDALIIVVSVVMVLLVGGLGISWWMNRDEDVMPADEVPVAQLEPAAPTEQEATPTEPEAATQESGETAPTAQAPSGQPAQAATVPAPAPVPATPAPVPATPTPAPVTTPVPEAQPMETAPVATAAPEPAPTPRQSVDSNTRLLLTVSEGSWIDIRDARDNKLIYETVPAGREVPLEGLAPFKVFLGNAAGVQIKVNGQDYDVTPHKRGLTARFTLKAQADTE